MQQPLREHSDLAAGQLRRLGSFSLIMHVHFSFLFLFLRIGTTEGPTQICSQRQNPLIRQRKEGVASCPDSHSSALFLSTQHYSIHRQPWSGKPKHLFHHIYPDTVVRHNSCWHDEFLDAAVTQERLGGCYNTSLSWSSMVLHEVQWCQLWSRSCDSPWQLVQNNFMAPEHSWALLQSCFSNWGLLVLQGWHDAWRLQQIPSKNRPTLLIKKGSYIEELGCWTTKYSRLEVNYGRSNKKGRTMSTHE